MARSFRIRWKSEFLVEYHCFPLVGYGIVVVPFDFVQLAECPVRSRKHVLGMYGLGRSQRFFQ